MKMQAFSMEHNLMKGTFFFNVVSKLGSLLNTEFIKVVLNRYKIWTELVE